MTTERASSYWQDDNLSINWHMFGLISLVLASIVLVLSLLISQWKTEEFESNRQLLHAQYEQQLNSLIENSADKVVHLANAVNLNNSLMEALASRDIDLIRSEVEELDWNLQADAGLAVMGLFDDSATPLHSLSSALKQESAQEVLAQERPVWQVDCTDVCQIVTYTALLSGGEVVGVISLAEPLSNVMLRFQHVANIDTVLLRDSASNARPRINQQTISPIWERDLVALTNPDKNKTVLDQASQTYSLAELNRDIQVLDVSPNTYELKALPLERSHLVVISDVSRDYSLFEETIDQTFRYSFIFLIIGEICLFLLLRRPLQTLHLRDISDGVALNTTRALEDDASNLAKDALLSESVNDSIRVGILVVDASGQIYSANRYFRTLTEMSGESLQSMSIEDVILADSVPLIARLVDVSTGLIPEYEFNAHLVSRIGEKHKLSWRYLPLYDSSEDSAGPENRKVLVLVSPLLEATLESERHWLEHYDKSFGILNRKGLGALLMKTMEGSESQGNAMLLLRASSDWERSQIAMISKELRPSHSLASLETNELAVVLPDVNKDEAMKTLQRLAVLLQGSGLLDLNLVGSVVVFDGTLKAPLTIIQAARDGLRDIKSFN